MINRLNEKDHQSPWLPAKQSRVCSDHFEDDLDYPVLSLGYEQARERLTKMLPVIPGTTHCSKYRTVSTSASSSTTVDDNKIDIQNTGVDDFNAQMDITCNENPKNDVNSRNMNNSAEHDTTYAAKSK